MTRCTKFADQLCLAVIAAMPLTSVAQDEVVVISKVMLEVKAAMVWVKSGGTLYRLTEKGRSHVAEVDQTGKLDTQVKCQKGDRFEAAAENYFDKPVPPPRLYCSEELIFKFSRALHNDWSKTGASATIAYEPFIFSELSTRTSQAGKVDASSAFSDAAVASTAKLLGDEKLDRFVLRDPSQDYKLVFNKAGQEALRMKQKSGGVTVTGQLDAPTQSMLVKEFALTAGNPTFTTPAVTCGEKSGLLYCASGKLPDAVNPTVSLPPVEFKRRYVPG